MKFCLATILVIFALVAGGHGHSKQQNESHSVTFGARQFRDTHIQRVIVAKKSSFLRVVTKDYKFQQKVG